MTASGLIFVEGKNDARIINKVIDGLGITVRQGAGKFGQKAYMDGFLANSTVAPNFYFAFRDRDFDYPMYEFTELNIPSPDKGKVVVSHRITIENYLLTPKSFLKFKDLDRQNKFKDLTIEVYCKVVEEVARSLASYQAVRHSLGKIRDRNQVSTTWTTGSGDVPSTLDAETCLAAGRKMVEDYRLKAEEISDLERFESAYEEFYSRFASEDFYQHLKFLEWFQAKDIINILSKRLVAHSPQFSMGTFLNVAIEQFEYSEFEDLVALRSHVEKLLNTEAQ